MGKSPRNNPVCCGTYSVPSPSIRQARRAKPAGSIPERLGRRSGPGFDPTVAPGWFFTRRHEDGALAAKPLPTASCLRGRYFGDSALNCFGKTVFAECDGAEQLSALSPK